VTTEKLAPDIQHHLSVLGTKAKKIRLIKEPVGRNTAPAIGLAAVHLKGIDPDAIMLVMPSDHVIKDIKLFQEGIKTARSGAEREFLVTFGIKPNKPETGYGYMEVSEEKWDEKSSLMKLKRFVEKPDLEKAKSYLRGGNYFWNSGIFVWKVSKILREIEQHLPRLFQGLRAIEETIGSEKERENPGRIPLQIIEVQNGDYIEEDDIERFDDNYGRV
jgi:mannose-1-phosphate guanylyltransferase